MRLTVEPSSSAGPPAGAPARPGFTIFELLTVILILVLLVSLSWGALNFITKAGKRESATNTVNAAVASARAYATRPKADRDDIPGAHFSGVALVFTGGGDIRIVENSNQAGLGAAVTGANPLGYLEMASPAAANLYSDIQPPRSPVALPSGSGVRGVLTPGAAALLPPPFAVHFDQYGQLVCGGTDPNAVHYPDLASAYPAVIGVIVFSETDRAQQNGGDAWVRANGVLLLFGRESGAAMTK